MSPKHSNGTGEGDKKSELDRAIEQGIDNLSKLRSDMREAGMTACADILDEAFVRCLQAYLEWIGADASPGDASPTPRPGADD